MNDLDQLAFLYRRHAHEAPAKRTNDAMLALAARSAARQRSRQAGGWLALALAASAALWLGMHGTSPPPQNVPTGMASALPAGYEEGRTNAFLRSMDIDPPPSAATRTLRDPTRTP
ncbi:MULTISPECIES: hypothetical protein [Luteibacter]|uniref:hypothetical protein n=1 Tax=Luteibacter TaxID=242605 RepID=UPI00055AF198|nr:MULTISPECIES: hypothetical protein [unclassified Luteibacter]